MPRCPKCRTRAELIRYEGIPVHNCGSCGGHWITPTRLAGILARREVVMPDAVKAGMIAIANAADSQEELWCMTCGKAMVKESFRHWPDIQIDRCPGCGGLWLDRGELEKCQIYWEYIQDHPDSDEARRLEKLATLDTRWAARKAELEEKIDNLRAAAHSCTGTGGLLAALLALTDDLDTGGPLA